MQFPVGKDAHWGAGSPAERSAPSSAAERTLYRRHWGHRLAPPRGAGVGAMIQGFREDPTQGAGVQATLAGKQAATLSEPFSPGHSQEGALLWQRQTWPSSHSSLLVHSAPHPIGLVLLKSTQNGSPSAVIVLAQLVVAVWPAPQTVAPQLPPLFAQNGGGGGTGGTGETQAPLRQTVPTRQQPPRTPGHGCCPPMQAGTQTPPEQNSLNPHGCGHAGGAGGEGESLRLLRFLRFFFPATSSAAKPIAAGVPATRAAKVRRVSGARRATNRPLDRDRRLSTRVRTRRSKRVGSMADSWVCRRVPLKWETLPVCQTALPKLFPVGARSVLRKRSPRSRGR